MTEPITSRQNQFLQLAKSLRQKKYRQQQDRFLAEGVRTLEELLASPLEVDFVLYCPELLPAERGQELLAALAGRGIRHWPVAAPIFRDLSDTESPQGIAAVVKTPAWRLADLTQKGGMLLILDGVQDPGNLGTMLRTAWAAAAGGVAAVNGAVDYFNPKTVRASMGAVFQLPLLKSSRERLLPQLRAQGYRILVADLTGQIRYDQALASGRVAWVMGSEAAGPDPAWLEEADQVVKIPLPGGAESLNVAVAAGILLYETLRQDYTVPKEPESQEK